MYNLILISDQQHTLYSQNPTFSDRPKGGSEIEQLIVKKVSHNSTVDQVILFCFVFYLYFRCITFKNVYIVDFVECDD